MKPIVFFDIDGTLLNDEQQLLESTRQAVQQLQAAGIETVIATGRTPATFKWVREALNIHSYVSLNGQYAVRNGEVIVAEQIPDSLLGEFANVAQANEHVVGFINENTWTVTMENERVHESLSHHGIAHPPVNAELYKEQPIYQGLLFCEEAEITSYAERFPELQFVRWHRLATDVQLKGRSKASGIEQYLRAVDARVEDSIAFGDGLNDKEMLQFVGTGIAMGNASDEVKQCANMVTASNGEDGIANALVELGLISKRNV
ncbi:Cof-type HAD-IIB family hydrolase [Paenibacillus sp. 481]|uniref:Cof-type HAD-IIB family hydrolase n=1 Tax=Paenibacillus sp. 481 TaxID=2835869 RepID=UPI001E5F86FE|nr:Cof-type HAD-IIB family hydrolase [Paenibacillus sp. 481]UHA72370.1 Cof-type HAD-IIB family hydrolase [Paenibacillus sp. 481]